MRLDTENASSTDRQFVEISKIIENRSTGKVDGTIEKRKQYRKSFIFPVRELF